jgi:hypothetical protein
LTVVEYDGDEHYRHSMKIKADRTKDDIASAAGFRVVRFPYWVQLDRLILEHWFNATVEIQQSFPHGFITTKIFPASFCELGIARFVSELNALPMTIREIVVRSLKDRAAEHGLEYVVPTALIGLIR